MKNFKKNTSLGNLGHCIRFTLVFVDVNHMYFLWHLKCYTWTLSNYFHMFRQHVSW